jgi:hypothetical protein
MSKELIFKEREITRRSSSYLGCTHPSFERVIVWLKVYPRRLFLFRTNVDRKPAMMAMTWFEQQFL